MSKNDVFCLVGKIRESSTTFIKNPRAELDVQWAELGLEVRTEVLWARLNSFILSPIQMGFWAQWELRGRGLT